jgi:hypothetical protein
MTPRVPRPRPIRLRGFDYTSPGAYFVTICTHLNACILGEVAGAEVVLSPFGLAVQEEWLRTAQLRPHVSLDEYVIMPNHVHGILILDERVGATPAPTAGAGPGGSPLRTILTQGPSREQSARSSGSSRV